MSGRISPTICILVFLLCFEHQVLNLCGVVDPRTDVNVSSISREQLVLDLAIRTVLVGVVHTKSRPSRRYCLSMEYNTLQKEEIWPPSVIDHGEDSVTAPLT